MSSTADRALVAQLVADGLSADEAQWAADKVGAAILTVLRGGKKVSLPDVGRLFPKTKRQWVPGRRGKQAREDRVVAFKFGAVLERGEPYDV